MPRERASIRLTCESVHVQSLASPAVPERKRLVGKTSRFSLSAERKEKKYREKQNKMSKKKKGKVKGVAPKPLVPSAMKSLKRARHVTSEFHRIQREIAKTEQSSASTGRGGGKGKCKGKDNSSAESASARRERKQKLERELAELGGRQAYQEASVLTTTRHRTCKWVFAIITKLGLRPAKHQPPLRVLEVGAVNTQLLSVPWLAVRAIDIKSQHPRIEQVDFFDVVPEPGGGGGYDAVVCSMVLNCVETPLKRGRMLALVRDHLRPDGHLFLMIPRRCVENSPYCSFDHMADTLAAVHLDVVETKLSPKVVFFCARRRRRSQRAGGDGEDDESDEEDAQTRARFTKRFADPPRQLGCNVDYEGGAPLKNDTFAVCFRRTDLELEGEDLC